ncbi:MAG: HAD-IG family 5'-nucleotidase [Planctomycetota bacterium]
MVERRGDGRTGGKTNPWWQDLVERAVQSPVLDKRRSIFTNRTLRFDKIKAVGFDFDHTLAIYRCEKLDELAMRLVIDRLIADEGMGSDFVERIPQPSFAVKGLIVDIVLGNVLKIDRYGHVLRAYHGEHRLDREERHRAYGDVNVIPMVTGRDRYRQLDSAYAKPDVLIFSGLAATHRPEDCRKLWELVRHHTDLVHRDGSLKEVVMKNPEEYLEPDYGIPRMLEELRLSGKKVFLLTNSEWEYTRAMFNPAIGRAGGPDDLGWVDLFDHVVCLGKKPKYFQGPLAGESTSVPDHAKVRVGGNIAELEAAIGAGGPDILYVGDHIYADLISSKRSQSWRTMLVISELEEEMEIHAGLPGVARQIHEADAARTRVESELHHWTRLLAALDEREDVPDPDFRARIAVDIREKIEAARRDLRLYIERRETLRNKMSQAMNPYWGSLFRASNELTYFGRQLEDFACTYTSRASNIGLYVADHYFRSAMDYLPHELESM